MIAEDTQLFFLASSDKDYQPSEKWEETKGPKCAGKLQYSSECKSAKRFHFRPLSVDFKLVRQDFYTAEDATYARTATDEATNAKRFSNALKDDLFVGYSAEGEFTIGLSCISTYFTGFIAQGASSIQTFPEIRLVTSEQTYRFFTCWITGIRFYYGRAGQRDMSGGWTDHAILQPLTTIRFGCQKATWICAQNDSTGKKKSNVLQEFAPPVAKKA